MWKADNPCRVTVTHQKSSTTIQPGADFFIYTTEAQQLLKQAQTYLAAAQDISLIHDRGHGVVSTGNYTQLWHSSVKFLILKVHLEKGLAQFLYSKVSEVAYFQVIKMWWNRNIHSKISGAKYGKYSNVISPFKSISVLDKEQNKSFDC